MSINSNVSDKFKSSNIEKVNATLFGDASIDMKNMTGVTEFTTTGSTGKVTLNNIGSATMALGFAGSTTNNIEANYTAGVLAGAADALTVNLNAAKGVRVDVDAGFESATINATGASDIATLTKPGIETIAVKGSGSVNFKDTLTNVKTLSATDATGAITTGTVSATTGFVDKYITAVTAGSSILLGAGDDNIGFQNTGATSTSTVMLGAGNDKLLLDAVGAGAVTVFGGAGDDHVRVFTSGLTANDVIDLGAGKDTVTLANGAANDMTLFGVENLALTKDAVGALDVKSADSSLAVTANVDGNLVNLVGLTAGSTFTTVKDVAAATAGTSLTVKFANTEAASTLTLGAGASGAITTDKITNVTINAAEALSTKGSAFTFTTATDVTINGTKDVKGTVAAADKKLENLTITSSEVIDMGDTANVDALKTVTATAAKAASLGTIDSKVLTDVSVASTGANVNVGNISATAGTTAATNVTVAGATTATVGTINAAAEGKLGNVSVTGTNGAVTVGAIKASALGTLDVTSTANEIFLGAGTALLDASDTTGVTVNLTAKTNIATTTGGTTAMTVNNEGAITASLAGAATAYINYVADGTAAAGSVVNLAATNTGGLTTTVTNNSTVGGAATSTITLGNAASTKSNIVTFTGIVDTLNVTGGTGIDNIKIDADQIKTGTIALGTGANILDFSTTTAGVAINLGSSTVTMSDTGSTTVASGKAVQYDATSASAKVVADGFNFTVSGLVTKFVGTAKADYIVANGQGTTITGGADADTIILGAGKDTVVYTALTDSLVVATGTTKAGIDTVTNFAAGTDKIDVTTVPTSVKTATQAWNTDWTTTIAAAYTAASPAANDALVITLTGTNAGTYLVINDGTVGWNAAADAVIELTGLTGTITTADFI